MPKHSRPARCLALAGLLLLAAATTGQAASISITNPGFEADIASIGTFPVGGGRPAGWARWDPAGIHGNGNAIGVLHPPVVGPGETDPALLGAAFYPDGAPEGNNVALVFMGNDATRGTPMGIEQTLGATLQANTRYTLQVAVGNIASGTGLPPADALGFYNLDGFPGYRIELLAGDNVLAVDDNSLAASLMDGQFAVSMISADIGVTHTSLGEALTIRLVNLNLPGTVEAPGIEVNFDAVSLDATAIPLPPAVLMLATSLLGLGALPRRRRVTAR